MDYSDWGKKLVKHFGVPTKDRDAWDILKSKYSIGDKVTGIVIAKAHFGAWNDIGVSFPALLEIINIENLEPADYQNDMWCTVDSEVEAVICGFNEENFQIHLTQKPL